MTITVLAQIIFPILITLIEVAIIINPAPMVALLTSMKALGLAMAALV
jgi:hypothetical protein